MGEYLQPLSLAFWNKLMEDLVEGNEEARLWLDTGADVGGFLYWCDMTAKDAPRWRAMLLRLWEMRGTANGKRALKKLREE